MNKGISFYFGYTSNYKKRAALIKKAGFDCIITNADPALKKQNGTIRQQVKLFNKLNLKLSSLHMTYKAKELPEFFKCNNIGDKIEKRIIKDLKIAKKYGFRCVVVHLQGEKNETGFKRLDRILEFCKKVNVPIAIENLDNNDDILEEVFMRYRNNEYMKFCYDIGHNNCFDPHIDYIEQYKDRLICLHLHDNEGKKDNHTLNKYGTINWDNFAKKIAEFNDINLDYELLMYKRCDDSEEVVLEECIKQARELEKKIMDFKNIGRR